MNKTLLILVLTLLSVFVNGIENDNADTGVIDFSRLNEKKINIPRLLVGPGFTDQEVNLQYEKFVLEHAKKVYFYQLISSWIILVFSLVIPLVGVILAIVQFSIAKKYSKKTGGGDEIELSNSKIIVKTSFIGVTILVISIAYIFLYLTLVYPIRG